ncbi:MAG: hypothetical protein FJ386_13835 [Verrucomicrobia bacterium]|nr:hypothetical protein [Verrucomicrobiota bacterium]
MKSGRFYLLAFPICIALPLGGCQKPEDKAAQESVRLLKEIKAAVGTTHRKGEAFLVLKSDAVAYMADMEIMCFKPDLKEHFAQWQQDWNSAYQAMLKENVAKDPELQTKLNGVDESIAKEFAKTNSLRQTATNLVANLASRLESEIAALVAAQAKTATALKEYQQITAPFDERLKTLKGKREEALAAQQKLTTETVEQINKHILEAQLKVPTLKVKSGEELFATSSRFEKTRPSRKQFLVKKVHSVGDYSDWYFFENIPQELEGTLTEAVVRDAHRQWETLVAAAGEHTRASVAEFRAKDEGLIPWQNRHGIDRKQGAALVSTHEQQTAKMNEIRERITLFKTGGTEGAALVEKAVKEGRERVERAVAKLREEREQIIENATEAIANGLRRQHRNKFYAMLGKQATTSVRTGSKGDFTVPADVAYVFAERQRDNGEHRVWFRRVESKSPDIRLSNSNSTDAADEKFWMFALKLD